MLKFEFTFSKVWSTVVEEQEEYEADNNDDYNDDSETHKTKYHRLKFCHLLLQYYLRSSDFYEQDYHRGTIVQICITCFII
jgi:hypothetical protein